MKNLFELYKVLIEDRESISNLPEENLIQLLIYNVCLESNTIIKILTNSAAVIGDDAFLLEIKEELKSETEDDVYENT
jgi:hypothetical protein